MPYNGEAMPIITLLKATTEIKNQQRCQLFLTYNHLVSYFSSFPPWATNQLIIEKLLSVSVIINHACYFRLFVESQKILGWMVRLVSILSPRLNRLEKPTRLMGFERHNGCVSRGGGRIFFFKWTNCKKRKNLHWAYYFI